MITNLQFCIMINRKKSSFLLDVNYNVLFVMHTHTIILEEVVSTDVLPDSANRDKDNLTESQYMGTGLIKDESIPTPFP